MKTTSVSSNSSEATQDHRAKDPRKKAPKRPFRKMLPRRPQPGTQEAIRQSLKQQAQPELTETKHHDRPQLSDTEAGLPLQQHNGFLPPPSILMQPLSAPQPVLANVAGSGMERAQAAALAERLVESVRVGRVGKDGHEIHVRIAAQGAHGGIEVRLRQEDGKLTAELRPDAGAGAEAERLVEAFQREADSRGLAIDHVEITF